MIVNNKQIFPGNDSTISYEEMKTYLDYDSKTGVLTWKINRGRKNCVGQQAGALTDKGYFNLHIDGKNYRHHRICWFLHYGSWPTKQIDHINGIRTDNRIENLREATNRQNCSNQIRHKKGKLVGQYYEKARKKYAAALSINNKKVVLGFFDNAIDAHKAYLKKVDELNGVTK